GRDLVAGPGLLGHRGAADVRPALENQHLEPAGRQVGGGHQTVVTAADDDRVVDLRHQRPGAGAGVGVAPGRGAAAGASAGASGGGGGVSTPLLFRTASKSLIAASSFFRSAESFASAISEPFFGVRTSLAAG